MPYQDLRIFLDKLKVCGRLHEITKEVDKDWELSAICRRVFQRFPQSKRPALLFRKVKDNPHPVVVGVLGGSLNIYALALECTTDEIQLKWENALRQPQKPQVISTGSCRESVFLESDVDLYRLPVPTWTHGLDGGPYITSAYVCTMDPETGLQNIGTYRLQLKGSQTLGLFVTGHKHISPHIYKNDLLGKPTPVAIAIGADPVIGLVSVAELPHGADELSVAGGLRGEPVEVIKAVFSDIMVPAHAEIVIEGEILPGIREHEGPFGEYTGYLGAAGNHNVIAVKALYYRNDFIYQGFVSQMPPSESSCIRLAGRETPLLNHLRNVLGLPVKDVHLKESGGTAAYIVISMEKGFAGQVQQVAAATWGFDPTQGKILVIVDADIDVRDSFQVDWALSFRMQPQKDVYIFNDFPPVRLDPSIAPYNVPEHMRGHLTSSKMLINATKKHEFPPIAIPPPEHLAHVDEHWCEYGFS